MLRARSSLSALRRAFSVPLSFVLPRRPGRRRGWPLPGGPAPLLAAALALAAAGCGDSSPGTVPQQGAPKPPAGGTAAAPAGAAAPAPGGTAAPQAGSAAASPGPAGAPAGRPIRVLLLSGGGYHEFRKNLDLLVPALTALGPFEVTELALGPGAPDGPAPAASPVRAVLDASVLRQRFDVILAYTQGELGLTEKEQLAILRFVRGGGGLVALHCALDSHPGWLEWVEMCGSRFERHPPFGQVQVRVDGAGHPVLAGLGENGTTWELRDEFYHLQPLEAGPMTLLMTGVSPEGGDPRPVTWAKPYGMGRVVCTILGHGPETHGDARYQRLVAQALVWAASRS